MILRNTLSWLVFRRGKLTSPLSISASTIKKPRIATIAVFGFGFLALAAALRLVFLDWGLPYVYHPDEPVNVDVIRRMIADSNPNPRFFDYPSILYYVNLPGQYLIEWWDGTLSQLKMQSMANGFTEQPEVFRVGRATTLAFGLAILPLLLVWARVVSVGVVGFLLLGILFCLNPLLLRHSTWITPNIFAAFFSTGTLLASSLIVLRGDRRSYIFAGVMAGLAASSKYNAGLVAVAIPAAHVLRNGLAIAELRPLVVAAVTSVLAFLLSSPFIVLDPLTAARSILIVIREYQTGHAGAEGGSLAANTWWMFDNFGYAGLLAVAACFSPRARALLPTGLFIVAYFILLVVQKVHFDRNLLPLVPAVLLLMAVGIDTISHMIARAFPNARTITSGLCGILALALFARPAMSSLDEVARYDPDPRAEARVWANGLLPRTPERAIAVEAYAPYIAEQGRAVKGIFLAAIMDPAALAPFSYLVLSRQGSGRYFQGSYATEQANLAALKARSCDRRQFPADSAEPDYVILIFECDRSGADGLTQNPQ